MTIETIPGNLLAYQEIIPGTMQHGDKLLFDQISNPELRSKTFHAADFPLYSVEKGEPTLWLARHTAKHPNNLVLVHLFDTENSSYHQLVTGDRNFRPNPDEAQVVMKDADTLRIPLNELCLQAYDDIVGDEGIYRFLAIRNDGQIRTALGEYRQPNATEDLLIKRGGYTPQFLEELRTSPQRITETKVFLLNPYFVVCEAAKSPVGRASWCGGFYLNANFLLDGRNVNTHLALRGVRRVVVAEEGDGTKK